MNDESSVDESLARSQTLSLWVVEKLDGLTIPELPTNVRLQLCLACYHVAIEHAQSIIKLVEYERFGSAFALKRPMFEAVMRGRWLRYSAEEDEIINAQKDEFPRFDIIANTTLSSVSDGGCVTWQDIKGNFWGPLCSYVHTGSLQILSRLSTSGIQAEYPPYEKVEVLHWADAIQLFCGVEIALAGRSDPLAKEFLECMSTRQSG